MKKEEITAATETLDGALAKIGDLVKSQEATVDVAELAKNKAFTASFLAELQKAGKPFPGAMAPYGKDGKRKEKEEDEDEKGEKKEKSFDFDSDTAQYVDAVPILKAFADAIEGQAKQLAMLKSEVAGVRGSIDEQQELLKAVAEVEQSSAVLVKSLSENIASVGAQPLPAKGVAQHGAPLTKAFGGGQAGQQIDRRKLESLLIKSAQDGKLDVGTITKYEATRNLGVLPAEIVNQALVSVEE